jgi:hypothetical protein
MRAWNHLPPLIRLKIQTIVLFFFFKRLDFIEIFPWHTSWIHMAKPVGPTRACIVSNFAGRSFIATTNIGAHHLENQAHPIPASTPAGGAGDMIWCFLMSASRPISGGFARLATTWRPASPYHRKVHSE